jgi:hypothetical protein
MCGRQLKCHWLQLIFRNIGFICVHDAAAGRSEARRLLICSLLYLFDCDVICQKCSSMMQSRAALLVVLFPHFHVNVSIVLSFIPAKIPWYKDHRTFSRVPTYCTVLTRIDLLLGSDLAVLQLAFSVVLLVQKSLRRESTNE